MNLEKKCRRCNIAKPLSEYSLVSQNNPKPRAQCKVCRREVQNLFHRMHPVNRLALKRARLKYEARNNKTDRRKRQQNETAKRMLKKFPEKWSARAKVHYALRKGELIKQPCIYDKQDCVGKVHAHHEDYSKPLEVIWYCHKHHMVAHNRYITL